MPMRENISVKLIGPREFPRYVLVHEDEFYLGPNDRWGLFDEAPLMYASLKRATTESLFLRDLAKLDKERKESEQQRHERERLENQWRRLSENENDEDDE